jgi:GNAT superfamily N-acetyltransferase
MRSLINGNINIDDTFLKIETTFCINPDSAYVLEFSVAMLKHSSSGHLAGDAALAHLQGYLVQVGYLPESDDEWYFDVFDMRSGHAMETFHVLADEKPLLRKALGRGTVLEECKSIAHIERVWVDPSLRGRRLALRLMREAQQVLARHGLLVVMKAHPDGDDVSDADCLKLAAYCRSDERLGFVCVSKRRYPGWLIAIWDHPVLDPHNQTFRPQT